MRFTKSHALGNDYIILEDKVMPFVLTKRNVQLLCDRHHGIGSDGILLLTKSKEADFGLRILNPDGSEAEKSGNGIRIFAKFLYDHGHTKRSNFSIHTKGGLVKVHLSLDKNQVGDIRVDMGKITFWSHEIPVSGKRREVVAEKLRANGKEYTVTCLSVGNPHCVVFTKKLDATELRKYGPLLEKHRIFPNRINVQFASVISRQKVQTLIWERGAGETMASGSSACAVAAAAFKNGLTSPNPSIHMPGGALQISVDSDWRITMTGSASELYTGSLSREFIQRMK